MYQVPSHCRRGHLIIIWLWLLGPLCACKQSALNLCRFGFFFTMETSEQRSIMTEVGNKILTPESSAWWMLLLAHEFSVAHMKRSSVKRSAPTPPSTLQPAGNPKAVHWDEHHGLYFCSLLSWSDLPVVRQVGSGREESISPCLNPGLVLQSSDCVRLSSHGSAQVNVATTHTRISESSFMFFLHEQADRTPFHLFLSHCQEAIILHCQFSLPFKYLLNGVEEIIYWSL